MDDIRSSKKWYLETSMFVLISYRLTRKWFLQSINHNIEISDLFMLKTDHLASFMQKIRYSFLR